MSLSLLVIDKIADQKIDLLLSILILSELIQYTLKRAGLDLVITVHDFEIQTGSIFKTCVDGSSVSLVGLMDRPYDPGIPLFEPVCDLCRIVG